MKNNIIKRKQYLVITVLFVISIALVGTIYTSVNRKNTMVRGESADNSGSAPIVEKLELNVSEESLDVKEVLTKEDVQDEAQDDKAVSVDPIDVESKPSSESMVVETETIKVPMAEEPEKPDLIPPEQKPITTDDLTNVDQQPVYDEKETSYIAEPEPVEVKAEEPRGTYTVPDSENPFLQDNIPSNGDGGEMMGKDYYQDGVPSGEGDKF